MTPTKRRIRPAAGLHRLTRSLFGAMIAPGLAGCMVGPDYVEPEPSVPDQWHQDLVQGLGEGQADLQSWWTVFNDPVLDSLIERTRLGNLDLLEAIFRIRQSRAFRGTAAGELLPTFRNADSYTRSEISEKGLNAAMAGQVPAGWGKRFADLAAKGTGTAIVTDVTGIPFPLTNAAASVIPGPRTTIDTGPYNLNQIGFDSSWEIDVFGGIRRGVESADAGLQASVERYRDTLVSLFAEVAVNYTEVRTLQARIRYAGENVERQRKSLDLATTRFETGLSPRLDIEQARSNLANTEAEIPLLQIGLAQAIHRLAVLLGDYPSALWGELEAPGNIPAPPLDVAVGQPVDIIRRRPDIRRAERQLAAFNARIGVATADVLPRFSLSGEFALSGTEIKDLGNINARQWSFGPSVRWNIFDGLRNINRIYAAHEATGGARARYEQTILVALEEVENAMVGFKEQQVRRDALSRAVTASAESVKLVRDLYENGLTDFQNVLDTERSLFRQQDAYAESQGQVIRELIALYKALGGGWRADEPPGVEQLLGPALLAEKPVDDPMSLRGTAAPAQPSAGAPAEATSGDPDAPGPAEPEPDS